MAAQELPRAVPQAGERLPIAEAARRLGLAPKTLRRRAQEGTIPAELRPQKTPAGWVLWVPQGYAWAAPHGAPRPTSEPSPEGSPAEPSEGTAAVPHPTPAVEVVPAEVAEALRAHVATLQDRLHRADEELDARRREVQELHVLLREAQQAQRALVAAGQSAPEEQSAREELSTMVDTAPRRTWWAFWRRERQSPRPEG